MEMGKEKERKHKDQFMQKVAQAKMAEEIQKMEREMEGKSYDEIQKKNFEKSKSRYPTFKCFETSLFKKNVSGI